MTEITKKQRIIRDIQQYTMIIIALSFIGYIFYSYGSHNGKIDLCYELDKVPLSNGKCLDKSEYEIMLNKQKVISEQENNANFIKYKNNNTLNLEGLK